MKKTNMNRREFNTLATSLGLLTFGAPLKSILANENIENASIEGKKLIILSLHGGCDTLNAFIPKQDNEYKKYKEYRSNIAIRENMLALKNNDNFVLHGKLEGLQSIYTEGDLAFFPATHCLNKDQISRNVKANRSHFYQLDLFERAGTTGDDVTEYTGWLAKYLNSKGDIHPQDNDINAFDFYAEGRVFEGSRIPVLGLDNPGKIEIAKVKNLIEDELNHKVRHQQDLAFSTTQNALFKRLARLTNIPKEVEENDSYPKTTLGLQFKQTSKMLKQFEELEVVQLVMGGWDTHANQKNTQDKLFEDLDKSLKAFYDDNSGLDNVMVVVQTEFGRTLQVNGTNGTDHGQASAWFVIGGSVNGGQRGEWKSLTEYEEGDRYIEQKTDYRDILGTILEGHMGMSKNKVRNLFNGYKYTYNEDFIPSS